MDYKKLIRNADKVKENLVELADGRLVCKKSVKIYIPARFAERDLAELGAETNIVGIYAISVDDTFYGISTVNAMMRIEPSSMLKVHCDGDEYFEFTFDAGSTVITNVNLVKTDVLVYKIYNELISKGRVPWYLGYEDLGKLFDTARYHADANIGENPEITELIVSIISRNAADRHIYYRQVIKDFNDLRTNPPAFIPMRSVIYAATNTLNKIAGSYAKDGLISALVSPTTRVEKIERLLRE